MAGRLERAGQAGAGVLAYAALRRLGFEDRAAQVLEPSDVLPQVGQGALAIECREDDEETRWVLGQIDNPKAHAAVRAERAFLGTLGGGCNMPVGALATWVTPAQLQVEGLIASLDGRVVLRHRVVGGDPEEAGRRLATELLDDCGGRSLL
jgi:hydroxymethylbilane synthase